MSDHHIKIPDIAPVIRYTANGVQDVFSFPFPIFKDEDLKVALDGVDQNGGYSVTGAGESEGGTVRFDVSPTMGNSVVLRREVPLERTSDFLESGSFSAKALNTELDTIIAGLQQVAEGQKTALRFPEGEPGEHDTLPDQETRSGRALAFDSQGRAVVVPHGQTAEDPNYIPSGAGAVTRSLADKARETVSPQDYGAKGDGIHDDTDAIRKAVQSGKSIVIPEGTYRVTGSITLPSGRACDGVGPGTVIVAATADFPVFVLGQIGALVTNMTIRDAQTAVLMTSATQECSFNLAQSLVIEDCETAIRIDGENDQALSNDLCLSNRVDRVRIMRPVVSGIVLTQSGANGAAPENTYISNVTIKSDSQSASGYALHLEEATGQTLIDSAALSFNAPTNPSVMVGAGAQGVTLQTIHSETTNATAHIHLAAGSGGTLIRDLNVGSVGTMVEDLSGGLYETLFSDGQDRLHQLRVGALMRGMDYLDTVSVSASTTLSASIANVVVNNPSADVTLTLPDASVYEDAVFRISRTDSTNHLVTITPVDTGSALLANEGSYMELISDGVQWRILSQSRVIGRTFSYSGSGTFNVDMAADLYLLSPTASGLTASLPSAAGLGMKGRILTFKNETGNAITLTESGASGPDGAVQTLNTANDAVTVMSNGSQWLIVSDYSQSSGSGGAGVAVRATQISGSGTITVDPNFDFFAVSNPSGQLTLRFPDPTLPENDGRMVWVKKTDTSSNQIKFTDVNNAIIDGNANWHLNGNNECFSFVVYGGAWHIVQLYFY